MEPFDRPTSLNTLGIRFGDRPLTLELFTEGDPISNYLNSGFLWHPHLVRFLAAALRPDDCFIDIGAHLGLFSLLAARRIGPQGKVIAVEPDPINTRLLARNIERDGAMIERLEVALSDSKGTATFYRSETNRALQTLVKEERTNIETTVVTNTFSDQFADLDRIDCVKLDVQGAETQVMKGMVDKLQNLEFCPYIIVEINPVTWVQADPGFAFLRDFTARFRYDVHVFMTSEGVSAFPPVLTWNTFMHVCSDIARFTRAVTDLDVILVPARPKG